MKKYIIIAVLLLCSGCIKTVTDGEATYRLDPNEAAKYEQVVEVTGGVMALLVPIFPFLAPILAAGGGAYAVYKNQKPKFTKEQTRADAYHGASETLVSVIEKFKETNPTEYTVLEERLKKYVGPETENIIRALRGLPPKE